MNMCHSYCFVVGSWMFCQYLVDYTAGRIFVYFISFCLCVVLGVGQGRVSRVVGDVDQA